MKSWWLITLLSLTIIVASPQAPLADESGSSDDRAPSSSEREPLTPLAKQLIEAAKTRLDAEQKANAQKTERARAKLRDQAERVAIDLAKEKAKQQEAKAREADRQMKQARERQLKRLYARGLEFYQQGAYQDAIEIFQQMALMEPSHDLVKAADRIMVQAETRLEEQRRRATVAASPGIRRAPVPELQQALVQKQLEVETTLKYAKTSMQEHDYDTAIGLLERALQEDPNNHDAGQVLQQAKMAKLKTEETHLAQQGTLDDQRLMNDVLKAELSNPMEAAFRQAAASAKVVSDDALDLPADPRMARKLQEPISFDFKDVALGDVIDFIADSANLSIIPSPRLKLNDQRVSLHVDRVPLSMALKYLVKSQGLAYRADDMAIRIASPQEFASDPLETRVFVLQNGLGPYAMETSAVKSDPVLPMASFTNLLERNIPQPPGSKIAVDERSGSLVVTNTAENLKLVERLLSQLDVIPPQVLIEARFVEVTLSELEQLGFESVLTGDAALTKVKAGDGTHGTGLQFSKSSGFKFPALSREAEGLNVTLQGVLTGTQFESVLHLLEETQKGKTLSAPRVTALNNQPATIKVVDEFRYPTRYEVSLVQFDINGDGDFDDAGETQFVNVPKDFKERDIGILLHVTPSIGKDLRTITLVLAPEVSQFSQFRDLGGGVTVPEFTSSRLTTSVAMEDGQTVVLGGLMRDSTSDQLTKIPVLGDLPVVGNLFRQKGKTQARKSLLIFVTARILAPRGPTT